MWLAFTLWFIQNVWQAMLMDVYYFGFARTVWNDITLDLLQSCTVSLIALHCISYSPALYLLQSYTVSVLHCIC